MHVKITFGHYMWRIRMRVSSHAPMVRFWSGFVAWNELHVFGFHVQTLVGNRPGLLRFVCAFVQIDRSTVFSSPITPSLST